MDRHTYSHDNSSKRLDGLKSINPARLERRPEGTGVMRKLLTLRNSAGDRIRLHLENSGGGIDNSFRRWMLEPDGWRCIETGELAQQSTIFRRVRRKPGASWRS
jgi:hypothetical protein